MPSNNYIQFDFEISGNEQAELLIAVLSEKGFEGFEENEGLLSAFIRENDFSEKRFASIPDHFKNFSYSRSVIEHLNWNQEWESSFKPVQVNNFAAIRAAFHEPINGIQYEIIITPKMSFGTGHHATTYLMVEQMGKLDVKDNIVLDFGTGTGILAILAEKMGAAVVTAVDNDEWSIENIKENIEANACKNIDIHQSDAIPAGKIYDLILANINLNVILANLDSIGRACKKGTQVLLSGFLTADEPQLISAVLAHDFYVLETAQKGDWLSLSIRKN